MQRLADAKFSEFSELVKFLSADNEMLILERISRFLPDLNAEQLFDIHFICTLILNDDAAAESAFNKFISENPDVMLDETGRSEPKFDTENFWEIKLKSLDAIYETAFHRLKENGFADDSKHKVDSQVYNGKKVANLINRHPAGEYNINKALYIKSHPESDISDMLSSSEKILRSFDLDADAIMNAFIDVISKKKYENYKVFMEHFLERLDCLGHDPELKNDSNRDFLSSLKKIK